ncbi:MAG: hypothetical protein M1838_002700 [Thelocarpon superellum]|nr:MAG: hypothetical protein M1838_002700 [Thelocarpon superellum]
MATLANFFPSAENSLAVIIPNRSRPLSVSFRKLHDQVALFQMKLAALGVTPQSAVSIALPNSYEFIVAFLASSWQRAVAAPLNAAYKQEEFEFYIDDLSSALALVPKGSVQQNSPAVPLTHRNLTRTMRNIKDTYKLAPQDRTLLVMPLFHVHGLLAGFLAPLHSGGCAIVPPRFSASDFWHNFTTYGANWYTAVPTIHQILLKTPLPSPIPSIRFIRSCSSPLSPSVFHQLEKTFNAPVLEAYAMTEAAHQMTSNPLPPAKRLPGSVGIGQGVEVKIMTTEGDEVPQGQEGEICIRGENVTSGYINNASANASSFTKEHFFRTGDQGKLDADGYVFITGRIKELINKGGEKISPIELDNVLAQHPAIAEVVSFAIDDDMYGQEVGVAVVLKDGSSLTADQLHQWVADRVARFKVPKRIFFTASMPKTATGKIQRRVVAESMLQQEGGGITKAKL